MSAKQVGYIDKKPPRNPGGGAKCTCSSLLKKFLSLILSVLVVGMSLPHVAWAEDGKCGDNVTWSLVNGTLTISGEGDMADYDDNSRVPWASYIKDITSVIIKSNVTSIGDWAFGGCRNLTSVTIPDSVETIGNYAFSGCCSLSDIIIPDSVENVGNGAFEYCSLLECISIPESVICLNGNPFCNCI